MSASDSASRARSGSRPLRIAVTLLFAGGALVAASGAATLVNATGISGYSGQQGKDCNSCHRGGSAPMVMIDGPLFVLHDSSRSYSLMISGGQMMGGGLDVSVDNGSLDATESDTHLDSGEVTHNHPKMCDGNGNCAWTFDFVAPSTPCGVTIYGAGASVNLNGNPTGDMGATTTLAIKVVDNLTSFVTFGQGTPGSAGKVPQLAGTDGPSVGPWSMSIANGLGGAPGLLLVGVGTRDVSPVFGGHLYVDLAQPFWIEPILLGGTKGAPGNGSLSIAGVDVSAFAPLTLYLQGLLIDSGAAHGVSMTNALEMDVAN